MFTTCDRQPPRNRIWWDICSLQVTQHHQFSIIRADKKADFQSSETTAGHIETNDADTATHRWRSDNRNEFRQDVRTWLTSFFFLFSADMCSISIVSIKFVYLNVAIAKRWTHCGWNISVVRRWGFSRNFSTCGFVDSDKVIRKCYFAYLIAKSILQLKPPIEGFSILFAKQIQLGLT